MRTIEHWIDGRLTSGSSSRHAPVFNPATGQQQAEVCLGSEGDVEAAIAAANDAFVEWSQTSLSKRTKVLFAFRELVNAHAKDIAELITDEHGKVLSDALGEVQRGLEVVEFACGIPSLLSVAIEECQSLARPVAIEPSHTWDDGCRLTGVARTSASA